jgi:hypothetical protein
MQSQGTFTYNTKNRGVESEDNYVPKEHKTIEETGSGGDFTSNKDDVHSEYRVSTQDLVRKKVPNYKSFTIGRSTDASSTGAKLSTQFPSLGKKMTTHSTNKILERIQQIEKVKQINKLKLEQELEQMNSNKISLDIKSTFARVSKYSNKYRY